MIEKDGQQVEVFTAAEVAAAEAKALETYQTEHPDQSGALTTAQTELAAAKTALEAATAGGDKDQNFAALRAAVKAAETTTETVKKEMMAEIEAAKNAPTLEYREETMTLLARGDKELKEKIEIRYKELAGMPEGNKKEVRARMEAAFQLAAGRSAATILDGGITSAGPRGQGGMPITVDNESDNSKAQRSVMGITDDVAKKYAPKPGQPGYTG